MTKVLLDSDVLLDFFFDRMPFSENSTMILTLCEGQKILGYITPVILSNVYYLLTKQSSHARVINKLNQLLTIVDILSMDRKTIRKALNSNFKDFEDALQNYAAENSKEIEIIITRNIKDYKESNLLISTPQDFLNARKFILE